MYVVYPLTSSKAGINRFVVGAPVEVTVDLIAGTTAGRKLRRSAVDVMTDLDKRMPRGIRWLRQPQ